MSREQYLQELFGRLSNHLSRRELESTMHYYEEYFEEAGPAREGEVMAELGTPEELAARILEARAKPRKSRGWVVGLVAGVGALALVITAGAWGVTHAVVRENIYPETIPFEIVGSVGEVSIVDGVEYRPGWNSTTYAELEPFTALNVELPFGEVNLVPSDHYGISVEWSSSKYQINYECDGGELHVWGKGSGVNFKDMDARVYIHVPEGAALDRVDLDVDMGNCWLGGVSVGELTVDADAGEVSLSNLSVETASLELDMGSLSINEVEVAALEAELSMGSLEGYGIQVRDSLKVENAMGDINLNGDLRGRIELTCNMGAISVYCSGSEEEYGYDLKTSLGRVCVDGWDKGGSAKRGGGSDFIKAKNDMGSIEVNFGY